MWTPEFGAITLKEHRSSSGRVYIRGWDDAGRLHLQSLDIPTGPYDAAQWRGS